jgi:hypothetical protein
MCVRHVTVDMIAVSLRQREHDLDDVFLWTSLYVRAIPWIPSTQRYLVVTDDFLGYI